MAPALEKKLTVHRNDSVVCIQREFHMAPVAKSVMEG